MLAFNVKIEVDIFDNEQREVYYICGYHMNQGKEK